MRLRELRESKGLSLDRLSQDLHINKSTLSRIENGLREPKQSFIEDCAKYFNVSIDYFLGGELNKKPKGVKIPVLGRVQAGVPIEAVTDIIDYEEITEELNRTGDFFALQVTGNSMEPRMLEGDVVIDPCAGSGTTLRACAELNRKCYGFEIDKRFYKAAQEKMLTFKKPDYEQLEIGKQAV